MLDWGQQDAGDVDVGGAGGGPDDDVGDVFGSKGLDSLVDLGGALCVSAETNEAEIGLDHAGIDAGYADRRAKDILAKAVVDQALCCFGSAIDRSIGVGEFAGG